MGVNHLRRQELLDEVILAAKNKKPSYLCAMNAHMTVLAKEDPEMEQALKKANWVVTDGVPVAWAFSKFNKVKQERIAGMDITPKLIEIAHQQKLTFSIFGNSEENLSKMTEFVHKKYPNANIGLFISPPFRPLTEQETQGYINSLNDAGTQLLFVSLGCPKQEKWMRLHSHKINGVCLGIGNAINTMIGAEKRPPNWVQKAGLEWFYRLAQNPSRLYKRYFVTNSKFVLMVFKKIIFGN